MVATMATSTGQLLLIWPRSMKPSNRPPIRMVSAFLRLIRSRQPAATGAGNQVGERKAGG